MEGNMLGEREGSRRKFTPRFPFPITTVDGKLAAWQSGKRWR
jgi:hypothetical protein